MTTFVSVDNDVQRIHYLNGHWTELNENGSSSRITGDQSATAIFDFEGVMISVVGTLNKTNAIQPLRYVLDGYEDHSFTLNGTLLSSRTLYTSPVLTPGNHSLVVTLMSNATALILDGTFIMANSTEGTKGKINHIPEIVGGTAGGVVFILLLLVLFFLHRLRRRNTVPRTLGPLQASLPMSKEAFTSRKYSHYGISFTLSAPSSTDTLTPLPQKSRTRDRDSFATTSMVA